MILHLGALLCALVHVVSAFSLLPASRNSAFLGCRPTSSATFDNDEGVVLVMRKQKASNKRTRRRQRGLEDETERNNAMVTTTTTTITQSPMQQRGKWSEKKIVAPASGGGGGGGGGGRGRSRRRSNQYAAISFYHDKFLNLLTREYKAEEQEVIGRLEASIDDPLSLERAGHALYDMYPTRRGNLFTDEVYRLTKAKDATTLFSSQGGRGNTTSPDAFGVLPSNHKFSVNDVILVTRQPQGSGDVFDAASLPISETAQKIEARVLGVGPTYIDLVAGAGTFEAAFGRPAPNDMSGKGDRRLRVRVDRFFSNVPYQRMVTALAQISQVPTNSPLASSTNRGEGAEEQQENPLNRITVDEVIRELVISTHAFGDPASPFWDDPSACNLEEVSNRLAKPPMASSVKLASEAVKFIQSNPGRFRPLNSPQLTAVKAALTRRCTLIQGPPGTGKTTVASAIGFGFVHQCRSLSPHTKVLATAFSNVGADNLAEGLLDVGLKVVRIGKPSAVSENLWNHTVDAAIDRDRDAQRSLQKAAHASSSLARLKRLKSSVSGEERMARQAVTAAVQASIHSCNLAATKAFREADVIVSTSTGAADPRLMAACGFITDSEQGEKTQVGPLRTLAPDGLPPLSMPFVLVDEAAQSLEPATLIPTISSNSCRSLVLLGDPCQLGATVRHTEGAQSPLSVSLMERLAMTLPSPGFHPKEDGTLFDTTFLGALPVRQARSVVQARHRGIQQGSYRKRFGGSFMLSVQYRMHPAIAAFPSGIFYDGLLSTPRGLADVRSCPILDKLVPASCGSNMNVRVVQIGGRSSDRQGGGTAALSSIPEERETSCSNKPEAHYVADLLRGILLTNKDGEIANIAVVTPYSGQCQLIKNLMSSDSELTQLIDSSNTKIEVSSVDAFQGRERDIVVFSAVRSNREGKIGFLHDWRRMNVALTRAKGGLIIVGDFGTLAPANANWDALRKWALGSKCFVEAEYSS